MKKKSIACLLTAALMLSLLSAAAFAQGGAEPVQTDGGLAITEPGSYVLTGKLTGCVYVDPGRGEVELVLDGVEIDGGNGPGIVALSGERLTMTLPENAVSRVFDGGGDERFNAAIYSTVDTVFAGSGALYVTGGNHNGILVEKADLTFNGGSYAIKAPDNGISARTLILNGGHFSIQAASSIDPAARLVMNGGTIEEPAPFGYASAPESSTGSLPVSLLAASSPAGRHGFSDGGFNNNQRPDFSGDGFNSNQRPDFSGDSFNGNQRSELPGGFGGQGQDNVSYADAPTEVVTGTVSNSAADLEADYDNATYISVTDDDSQVKITSSGTYVISGSSSDGNITVKKNTTGVVLVLEDLDLTSTTGATVSVNKEAEVKIIIAGNVVLTDNENPDDEDSADADVADAFDGAALKVKANAQVYVTGDGVLTIHGNAKNGIKAGDDASLIFDGVTVNITAVNDGINANYDVTLLSGDFSIAAGDDAIHADRILTVGKPDGTGPVIRVTESYEGLEGTVVNIYGGELSIVSEDDAVNAANSDGTYEGEMDYAVNMLGGHLVINSRADGIDSNGNVNLIGGSAEIQSASFGGEAGIDYDGQLYLSDDFQLDNQSGIAGPDGQPGGMGGPGQWGGMGGPGQQGGMSDQQFGPGQGFGGRMSMDGRR